jgi:hypothetical protein
MGSKDSHNGLANSDLMQVFEACYRHNLDGPEVGHGARWA